MMRLALLKDYTHTLASRELIARIYAHRKGRIRLRRHTGRRAIIFSRSFLFLFGMLLVFKCNQNFNIFQRIIEKKRNAKWVSADNMQRHKRGICRYFSPKYSGPEVSTRYAALFCFCFVTTDRLYQSQHKYIFTRTVGSNSLLDTQLKRL